MTYYETCAICGARICRETGENYGRMLSYNRMACDECDESGAADDFERGEIDEGESEQGTWDHDREGRVAGWKNGDGEGLVCADCARETDGDPVTMAEAGLVACCVRCGKRIA